MLETLGFTLLVVLLPVIAEDEEVEVGDFVTDPAGVDWGGGAGFLAILLIISESSSLFVFNGLLSFKFDVVAAILFSLLSCIYFARYSSEIIIN